MTFFLRADSVSDLDSGVERRQGIDRAPRTRRRGVRRTDDRALTVVCAFLSSIAAAAPAAQQQQAAPIDTVSPSPAAAGEVVTITGIGFGARNVRIAVGGIDARVMNATGSRVTFIVPEGRSS